MTLVHHTGKTPRNATGPTVALSACLLGHEVRFDGGQKRHAFITEKLTQWLKLIPICPEVETGMGIPRPPIQLLERGGTVRAVGVEDPRQDFTQSLKQYGRATARQLEAIDGYIFKARSPSCGVNSTPINIGKNRQRLGAGLFAAQIKVHLPLLPVVEELQLESVAEQINFIQQVLAYKRWRELLTEQLKWRSLYKFHQANRYLLMAHGINKLRELDRWLESIQQRATLNRDQLQEYGQQYMSQYAQHATRKRQVTVLKQIVGLSFATETNQLDELIDAYSQGTESLFYVMQQFCNLLSDEVLAKPGLQEYLSQCSEPGLSQLMKSVA